jgi:hypothetical protein
MSSSGNIVPPNETNQSTETVIGIDSTSGYGNEGFVVFDVPGVCLF